MPKKKKGLQASDAMAPQKIRMMKFISPVAPMPSCGEAVSFSDWMAEQAGEPALPDMDGININDDEQPWTEMILKGDKTIETRLKPTLNRFVGKRVGIVRTRKGQPAMLVGYATVGEPIAYHDRLSFDKDFPKHRVGQQSTFHVGYGSKYGYPLTQVRRLPEPYRTTSRSWPPISRKVPHEMTFFSP